MHTALIEWVGLAAAFCTTVAYIPQVLRVWRTRSTQDISLGTFSVLNVGIVLWLIYGFAISSLPIILANIVTLLLTGAILGFKLRHG